MVLSGWKRRRKYKSQSNNLDSYGQYPINHNSLQHTWLASMLRCAWKLEQCSWPSYWNIVVLSRLYLWWNANSLHISIEGFRKWERRWKGKDLKKGRERQVVLKSRVRRKISTKLFYTHSLSLFMTVTHYYSWTFLNFLSLSLFLSA